LEVEVARGAIAVESDALRGWECSLTILGWGAQWKISETELLEVLSINGTLGAVWGNSKAA
jgi:hypothetical protein